MSGLNSISLLCSADRVWNRALSRAPSLWFPIAQVPLCITCIQEKKKKEKFLSTCGSALFCVRLVSKRRSGTRLWFADCLRYVCVWMMSLAPSSWKTPPHSSWGPDGGLVWVVIKKKKKNSSSNSNQGLGSSDCVLYLWYTGIKQPVERMTERWVYSDSY